MCGTIWFGDFTSMSSPRINVAEHKKGDLGVKALIIMDLECFSGPHYESLSDTLHNKYRFCCSCCSPVTFQMILTSESGRLGQV